MGKGDAESVGFTVVLHQPYLGKLPIGPAFIKDAHIVGVDRVLDKPRLLAPGRRFQQCVYPSRQRVEPEPHQFF